MSELIERYRMFRRIPFCASRLQAVRSTIAITWAVWRAYRPSEDAARKEGA